MLSSLQAVQRVELGFDARDVFWQHFPSAHGLR